MVALAIFGLWGFFPKLAVRHIDPASVIVYGTAGSVLVGFLCLAFLGFRPSFHPAGAFYAFITGVCGVAGSIFYFVAARTGKISIVVALTALYPLVTILLARVFLGEVLGIRQTAGILLACLAIYLLVTEG